MENSTNKAQATPEIVLQGYEDPTFSMFISIYDNDHLLHSGPLKTFPTQSLTSLEERIIGQVAMRTPLNVRKRISLSVIWQRGDDEPFEINDQRDLLVALNRVKRGGGQDILRVDIMDMEQGARRQVSFMPRDGGIEIRRF